jgi:spore coat protein JB
MNEREMLLRRVQVCDFAMNDAALFLDNNPNDAMALEYYRKHQKMRDKAVADYTAKFGPLTRGDAMTGNRWAWTDNPWPWQLEEDPYVEV